MAAPTIVAGSTKLQQTSNATNHVINTPTHTSGDVIYIAVCAEGGSTVTRPTDFSNVYDAVSVDAGAALGYVWKKTAGGSEPASYTYTVSPSERSASIAWAVRGDGGIDAQGTNATGSSSTATVPAVVSTVNDCLRISVVFVDFGNTTTPHGTATNGHSDIDEAGATSGGALSVHYKALPSSGSDSSATVSLNASEGWVGVAWAIAPVAGGTTYTKTVAGTLTSSGGLVRKCKKVVAGTLTTAGVILRKAKKVLAGTLTTAGATLRKTKKSFAGTLTTAGVILRKPKKMLAGTLTTAGAITRKNRKSLAGTLTSAGAITRKNRKSLAGTLTTSGATTRKISKVLAGTLTSIGGISRKAKKVLAGVLTSAGEAVSQKFGPAVAAVALTLANRASLTLPPRSRELSVMGRTALTLGTKVRELTVNVRKSLTLRDLE